MWDWRGGERDGCCLKHFGWWAFSADWNHYFTQRPPMYIPIAIPKGTRVAVRTQPATASRVCRVHMWGESGSSTLAPDLLGM